MNVKISKTGRLRHNKLGHTLLELIVVIGLFMLAGILTLELFKYGTRSYSTISTRLDNQGRVLKALHEINRDIEQSTIESLGFSCNPGSPCENQLAMCFLTPLDMNGVYQVTPENVPLYQAYIMYYYDIGDKSIKKLRKNLATPSSSPVSLTEDEINDWINDDGGSGKKVLEDVKFFRAFDARSGDYLTKAKETFRIEIEVDIDDGKLLVSSKFSRTYRLIK